MRNTVMPYGWGCTSSLANLQGRKPSGAPEAELWMGAYPAGSSHLLDEDGRELNLAKAIAADALSLLGSDCIARFGARLPFLLKILAIETSLSIQVHPNPEQAAAGFADEQARGVAPAERTFKDAHSKPEQFVALTPVSALAGLRPADEALQLVRALRMPELEHVVGILAEGDAKAAFLAAVELAVDEAVFVTQVRQRATDALSSFPAHASPDVWNALSWVIRLSDQHPTDVLVIAPLLLHLHHLAPGESMFVPDGAPHAYLEGLAVEVQGASDNVARGGLTTKKVDVPVLRELLTDAKVTVQGPAQTPAGQWHTYPSPAPEFSLHRLELDHAPVAGMHSRPQILLCVSGAVEVHCDDHTVALTPGESAFVAGHTAAVTLSGQGVLFAATTGC